MSRRENRKLEKLKKARKRKKILKCMAFIVIIASFFYVSNTPEKEVRNFIKDRISAKTENTVSNATNQIIQNTTIETVSNVIIEDTEKNETVEKVVEEKENETVRKIVEKYIDKNNLNQDNFAFFYYNPITEESYFYNENSYFTAASTIKVPLAMIYYDKINNGDLTLKSTFTYNKEHYEEGAGTIVALYKPGEEVPLQYLLEQMIVNSDNTATNILKTGLGGEKAYRILIKQYTQIHLPSEFNEDNITSAAYSLDVLKKIYNNQDDYQRLIELMKKSSGGGYLKKDITNCEIAHKYGSYEGNVHDYGICYSNNPYLIGVFTKNVPNAENLISTINKEILSSQK